MRHRIPPCVCRRHTAGFYALFFARNTASLGQLSPQAPCRFLSLGECGVVPCFCYCWVFFVWVFYPYKRSESEFGSLSKGKKLKTKNIFCKKLLYPLPIVIVVLSPLRKRVSREARGLELGLEQHKKSP